MRDAEPPRPFGERVPGPVYRFEIVWIDHLGVEHAVRSWALSGAQLMDGLQEAVIQLETLQDVLEAMRRHRGGPRPVADEPDADDPSFYRAGKDDQG